ncbi:hypothetical protein [endosymbiont GvMRE of Glomus versiforme]|uniref:hypothetical protein n=1 Tax=endosymbiont GvMRE of Glomus versiforme TaxID=2039283 RepID=UPI000ED333AA|nr:hypothetical protein [endosymbiont GvMRE of Glomus versiforme]RHZ36383.1 hypothetical protein GvMRE_Ic1g212 [endosymbiont GvMRE of Glomus versiforme]
MDKVKQKINALKEKVEKAEQENEALRSILFKCSCGNIITNANLASKVQQEKQILEAFQVALVKLKNKLNYFVRHKLNNLLDKLNPIIIPPP